MDLLSFRGKTSVNSCYNTQKRNELMKDHITVAGNVYHPEDSGDNWFIAKVPLDHARRILTLAKECQRLKATSITDSECGTEGFGVYYHVPLAETSVRLPDIVHDEYGSMSDEEEDIIPPGDDNRPRGLCGLELRVSKEEFWWDWRNMDDGEDNCSTPQISIKRMLKSYNALMRAKGTAQ